MTDLAPSRPLTSRWRGRALQVVVLAVPLVLLLAGAWSRRWTADDGFINLRIVEQLWAGNGPVWNATERVETGTSPLWLAVLAASGAALRFVALEWVSVALGIAATLGGLAAAVAAARVLHRPADGLLVPVGALAVAALPPFWDFASSGLETGLSFLWLGLSGWAISLAATRPGAGPRPIATAVLLGLGPLVRPDLALVSAAVLLALLACSPTGWRHRVAIVVAAAVLPVGYQLFRMAYFATIVPNTALAKEGGTSRWDAGWRYAADYAGSWRLWWPAAVVAVVAVPAVRRWSAAGERDRLVVAAALTVGAALHALYVVRVGGDFMHARLLLPATFAALVPWAVVPLRRVGAVAAAALVVWAVLATTTWSPLPPGAGEVVVGVLDERAYYVGLAGAPHPVTAGDFTGVAYATAGRRAAATADAGRGSLTLRTFEPDQPATWSPLRRPDGPFAVSVDNIGVFGFLAGPDVTVIDRRGLGDPVTSRFRLEGERGRPGHEKTASDEWVVGRHGAPGAAPLGTDLDAGAVAAAREATACGLLADVLEGISEPLTPARAMHNVGLAVRSYPLRISRDPDGARRELCG